MFLFHKRVWVMYASIVTNIAQQLRATLNGEAVRPEQCMQLALHAMQSAERLRILSGSEKKAVVLEALQAVIKEAAASAGVGSDMEAMVLSLLPSVIDAVVQFNNGTMRLQVHDAAVSCCARWCGSRKPAKPAVPARVPARLSMVAPGPEVDDAPASIEATSVTGPLSESDPVLPSADADASTPGPGPAPVPGSDSAPVVADASALSADAAPADVVVRVIGRMNSVAKTY